MSSTSAPLVKVNSTFWHRLVLFIELGTVQTGTGKVDLTRKFKCTTAARDKAILLYRYLENH